MTIYSPRWVNILRCMFWDERMKTCITGVHVDYTCHVMWRPHAQTRGGPILLRNHTHTVGLWALKTRDAISENLLTSSDRTLPTSNGGNTVNKTIVFKIYRTHEDHFYCGHLYCKLFYLVLIKTDSKQVFFLPKPLVFNW